MNINKQDRRAAWRMTVQNFDVGRTSITYDAADQITTRAELDSAGALTATFDYGYDPAGNRFTLPRKRRHKGRPTRPAQ